MIQNGYKEIIGVKYSEIDQNEALKPYSLLNYLQDIASKNAEDCGFGYSFVHPKNYAWFLLKYKMEFINYPCGVQDLVLKTEPRGYNKLFAYRDFEIFSKDILLGRVHSLWTLVDIDTRTIVPVQKVLEENKLMKIFEKRNDDLSFSKISQIASPCSKERFTVRYNDIDVNGHANNGNYIVWAFEPLSLDFRNSNRIKMIDMVFKKEVKYGDVLFSEVEVKENYKTLHRLYNMQNDDVCLLECDWEPVL